MTKQVDSSPIPHKPDLELHAAQSNATTKKIVTIQAVREISPHKLSAIPSKKVYAVYLASGTHKHVYAYGEEIVILVKRGLFNKLKNEYELVNKICSRIKPEKGCSFYDPSPYLALNMEEWNERIELASEKDPSVGSGKYLEGYKLKSPRAKLSLESILLSGTIALSDGIIKSLSLEDYFDLCEQLLGGVAHLHTAGFIHGDIKLDNLLVYIQDSKLVLKLSDFGQAKDVHEKPSSTIQGNLRYSAPEHIASQASDIWATALVMIRILETAFLGREEMLVEIPDNLQEKYPPHPSRKGIERYIVLHKGFPRVCENKGTLFGLAEHSRRRKNYSKTPSSKAQILNEHSLIMKYMAVLTAEMVNQVTNTQLLHFIPTLELLLIQMLEISPNDRIEAKAAYQFFQGIRRGSFSNESPKTD